MRGWMRRFSASKHADTCGGESSFYLAFISSTSFLACSALPGFCMKVADCETTTGHVGRFARTLMKDARRGLNR